MSGPNSDITNTSGPASGTEPSMEEILASIRRILRDEQSGEPEPAEAEPEDEEILVLDSTMAVKPPYPPGGYPPGGHPSALQPPDVREEFINADPEAESPTNEEASPHLTSELSKPDFSADDDETFDLPVSGVEPMAETPAPAVVLTDTGVAGSVEEILMSDDSQETVHAPHGIVGESASSAAVSSIGSLIRSIGSERSIAIGRPGLTLEDLVREELRPLLKSWLDSNLPSLVERIVRAEIQRVVERTGI